MIAFGEKIILYKTVDGKEPFIEWLSSLKDKSIRARIAVKLDRIECGNVGDRKSLGGGLFEMRLPVGPGYRIYFGIGTHSLIILLCAGDKRTQQKDIKRAKDYLIDYKKRCL